MADLMFRGRLSAALHILMVACFLIASASAQERPVVVFAAASLQTALNAVAGEWRRSTGRTVTFSFAASSALARQLEQGAPADIFASADLDWMDWASERRLIQPGTRRNLLGNTLVLIAGRDDPVRLAIAPGFALAEEIGVSRLATGSPQAVPVGRYAQQALTALGVWPAVQPRIGGGGERSRGAGAGCARGRPGLGSFTARMRASSPAFGSWIPFRRRRMPHRLSGRAHGRLDKSRRSGFSRASVVPGRDPDLRSRGLHDPALTVGPAYRAEGRAGWSGCGSRRMEWVAVELSFACRCRATLASLPAGIAVAWLLARGRFPGKVLLDGWCICRWSCRPSSPVMCCWCCSAAVARSRVSGAEPRHRPVLSLDGCGAGLRGHGLSADGAGHSPRHRGHRPAAGTGGRHPCASPLWVFATVTLPLALPGILAGAVLCFAKALGEFGATITFSPTFPARRRPSPPRSIT